MAPQPQQRQKKDDDPQPVVEEIMESSSTSSRMTTILKLVAASAFLYSAVSTYQQGRLNDGSGAAVGAFGEVGSDATYRGHGRRLMSAVGDSIPSYMDALMKDLRERKKLFDETPPEEVKYWFEYTGPLQVRRRCRVGLLFSICHLRLDHHSRDLEAVFEP